MKSDIFQSCGHCWVFQICWHIECSTLIASSFRIWNSSTGILTENSERVYFWGAPKSLQMVTTAMKLKNLLLLGRKAMSNLDSILKSKDITLPTKVHLVKAMVFPAVMYECESWTIKIAEHQIIDAFELQCWRRLFKSDLDCKEIQPVNPKGNQSWIFIWRTDAEAETPILWPSDLEEPAHLKRPWCWERLKAGGEGDDRRWDGWMASPTWWTWVWVSSGNSWWHAQVVKNLPSMQETRIQSLGGEDLLKNGMATHSSILAWRLPGTEDPSVLQSMGSQSQTQLNWTEHLFPLLGADILWGIMYHLLYVIFLSLIFPVLS